MNKQVLFIQGGGGPEDYAADAKLVASLQESLGRAYAVHYPFLPDESEPDYGRKKQIEQQVSLIKGDVIVVGHSLGASMLLKYLSESELSNKIVGAFLIATPFWQGDEAWKQGLKLQPDFARRLPGNVPLFFYHSQDDEEVAVDHLVLYAQTLPQATIRRITKGGHQLNNDLSAVAQDILSL